MQRMLNQRAKLFPARKAIIMHAQKSAKFAIGCKASVFFNLRQSFFQPLFEAIVFLRWISIYLNVVRQAWQKRFASLKIWKKQEMQLMAKYSEESLYEALATQLNWTEKRWKCCDRLDEINVWIFFEIVVFKNRIKFTKLA